MPKNTSNLASLLCNIERELEEKTERKNQEELRQLWGVCLYYFYRYTSSNDEKYIYKCIQLFNGAISEIIVNKEASTSLHDGLGGFYFLYRKLIRSYIIV